MQCMILKQIFSSSLLNTLVKKFGGVQLIQKAQFHRLFLISIHQVNCVPPVHSGWVRSFNLFDCNLHTPFIEGVKDFPSLNGILEFHIQCVLVIRLVCGK